jgi:DNA-binding transcriptional regulator YiaG
VTDLTPEHIRQLRGQLGLTQAEFAARIGCSTQAVSFWERGTRSPTGLYARAVLQLWQEVEQEQAQPSTRLPPLPNP